MFRNNPQRRTRKKTFSFFLSLKKFENAEHKMKRRIN